MSYLAYLCYPRLYFGDCLEDSEPVIKFEKPEDWEYEQILPIQFSVLHSWPNKDKDLHK